MPAGIYKHKKISLEKRFLGKVKKSSGCWIWNAATQDGYGIIKDESGNKKLYASRVSWEFKYGSIPARLCVLHKCDNPPCVNPKHLFLGTRGINNKDRAAKRRNGNIAGERHPMAKLTIDRVKRILSLRGKLSQAKISRRENITRQSVWQIHNGISWKCVSRD